MTYTFTAGHPGTYLYESGTDQGKQLDMGLIGTLVVRPSSGPAYAYDRIPGHATVDTAFNPDTEYVMLLSQTDPALHRAVQRGLAFDMRQYHPRYYFVNGRSFPDTIAPNGAPWLPAQPYSSLLQIQPKSSDPGNAFHDPALVRYLSAGPTSYPFHPHGNHGRVIARDGRQLVGPNGEDLSYEKYTAAIGPGQTADATYTWADVDHWDPNTNPVPVEIPPLQNLKFVDNITYSSGTPYLGYKSPMPVGTTSFNECGEYYFMAHSHALYQITNFGAAGGGMLTLMRIDPPGGCHS
jgi:FtsP/CotA-like multicopper oxidase with cupredoxin domain